MNPFKSMILFKKNFYYAGFICLEENYNELKLKELFSNHVGYVSPLHKKGRPHYHICFLDDSNLDVNFIESLCELCKVDKIQSFNNRMFSFKKFIQSFNDIDDKEFF